MKVTIPSAVVQAEDEGAWCANQLVTSLLLTCHDPNTTSSDLFIPELFCDAFVVSPPLFFVCPYIYCLTKAGRID
jgi:hypothetical protein